MKNTKIIGIDPGLVNTGVCVIEYVNNEFKLIKTTEINTSTKELLPQRLYKISKAIEEVFLEFPGAIMGLEESYVNMNAKSSLKLGMVAGVILALGAKHNMQINFMSATHIKKQITGSGHSTKEIIYNFVSRIIVVPNDLSHHIYDAIAIAILSV